MQDSDIESEAPVPEDSDLVHEAETAGSQVSEPVAPEPTEDKPRTEMDDDEDSDLPNEDQATSAANKPFFDASHWSDDKVYQKESMVKDRPSNFDPPFTLIIPTLNTKDATRVAEALEPVVKHLSPQTAEWLRRILAGQSMVVANGQFESTLQRDGSLWVQAPEHDGIKLVAQVPAIAQPAPGTILTGQDAEIHMAQQTKTYARMMFPLYHTGIWLNVAVPHGSELHTLEEAMAAAKYDLGWVTKGLVYSNTSVMQNIALVNFVLDHVINSSAEHTTTAFLKKVIRITDINLIAANMSSAIYPSGFPLERPCSADPMKCHTVTKGVLRLSKIIWTDDNGLSVYQKKFMSTRLAGQKKTEADFKKYQEEFPGVTQRVVEIAPGISVRLMPPTIEQYEQSGYAWIESIERSANAMLNTPTGSELNTYMTKQYQLQSMRQYAHWVDAIVYPNDVTVVDRETINNLLAKQSDNTELVDKFVVAVKQFIEDCVVSVVGINNYSCPNCGKSQTAEGARNPKLIPLDPVHTFFTLSGLKTQTTLSKNMEH